MVVRPELVSRGHPRRSLMAVQPQAAIRRAANWGAVCLALAVGMSQPFAAMATVRAGDGTQAGPSGGQTAAPTAPFEPQGFLPQRLLRTLFAPVIEGYAPEARRNDLTAGNFFTYGWAQGWSEPEEGPQDAPRFRLLQIQRAFWERELRLTYNFSFRGDRGSTDEQEGEFELELPISRRFLIEFEGGVAATRPDRQPWRARDADLRITPELMLMESHTLSFSSGLVVRTPTGGDAVAQGRTSLTPYLALWKDLSHRIGLHTYAGAEVPLGGFGRGAPDTLLQYAIAPTITVTPKHTEYLGDLTFFVEVDGESSVGAASNDTTLTLLPGVRWMIFEGVWVGAGYQAPLTGTSQLTSRLWLSLYLDF